MLHGNKELKKTEKETKHRKLELERLLAASRELEGRNSLMKAEEMAQLKWGLAAKENNRRNSKTAVKRKEGF